MKKWLSILFLCGALYLNGWSQVNSSKGTYYLHEQQFGRAKSWFLNQLILSSTDALSLVGLGNVYLALNMADSAQFIFQKAVALNPKNPFAISGLGKVALLKKDHISEIDYFDRARRTDKTNPEIYCDIADGCTKLSRLDTVSALVYLNQGLSINPKYSGLHFFMGNLEIIKKNFGAAINAFDRAVFFDPLSSEAYRNLGYVYTLSRAFQDAHIALNKSIAIRSDQILAYRFLGDLFYTTGKYKEGEKAYQTYLSSAEATSDDLERFAILLFFNKKYQESALQLERIKSIGKDESVILRIKGYIACETGDYKNGVEYMNAFFKLSDPKKLIAHDYIYYARLMKEDKNETAAIESFRKAIALDPSKTEIWEELARLCAKNNLHREAAGYYKRMAETGSDMVVSNFQIGKEFYFEGEKWKSRYDSLLQFHHAGKIQFADSLTLKKNKMLYYSKADSAFTVVNKLNPEYAGGFIWKGRIQSLLDPDAGTHEAKEAYEKALILLQKGDLAKNRTMMIECYRYLGSWYFLTSEKYAKSDKGQSIELQKKSFELFGKITELDPSDAQAKAVLAKIKGKK